MRGDHLLGDTRSVLQPRSDQAGPAGQLTLQHVATAEDVAQVAVNRPEQAGQAREHRADLDLAGGQAPLEPDRPLPLVGSLDLVPDRPCEPIETALRHEVARTRAEGRACLLLGDDAGDDDHRQPGSHLGNHAQRVERRGVGQAVVGEQDVARLGEGVTQLGDPLDRADLDSGV